MNNKKQKTQKKLDLSIFKDMGHHSVPQLWKMPPFFYFQYKTYRNKRVNKFSQYSILWALSFNCQLAGTEYPHMHHCATNLMVCDVTAESALHSMLESQQREDTRGNGLLPSMKLKSSSESRLTRSFHPFAKQEKQHRASESGAAALRGNCQMLCTQFKNKVNKFIHCCLTSHDYKTCFTKLIDYITKPRDHQTSKTSINNKIINNKSTRIHFPFKI